MCHISHLIIMVNQVDAGVHQCKIGAQFGVAGIQHVGQQGKLVAVAVAGHAVILISKLHVLP